MRRPRPVLHDYQRVAVEHLGRTPRGALFLDMGLGKTACTLSALTDTHLPALVVAPKRVAENVWSEEVALWRPDLTVALACGAPAARERALRSGADIVVIGRDNLAHAVKEIKRASGPKFATFVMDEMSSFKSRAAKRWRAAAAISKQVTHVWGLTGTPAPQSLLDLWPQLYLLDGGTRLGATLTAYRDRYFVAADRLPSGVVTRWDLRPGAAEAIHRSVDDICLAMASEGRIDLPPVSFNTVKVTLPPKVRRAYKDMKRDFVAYLDVLGFDSDDPHTASSAAILGNKLAQISAGFLYADDADLTGDYTDLHREKTRAVEEIVEGTGSPVLVFYRYRPELDMLKEAFGDRLYTADEPALQKRWNAREFPILAMHPASAGHGLNLQRGGHTIVWTSLPQSLEEWEQANKRLARQGQTDPVVIHTIEAEGTADPKIADALRRKQSVQRALLDHLESPL